MAKHALKPEHSTHNKMKLIIPIITAGAILSSTAIAAQADTGQHNTVASVATQQTAAAAFIRDSTAAETPEISVPAAIKINFERTAVESTPAPKPVVPPAAAVEPPAPVAEPAKNITPAPAATKPAAPPTAAAAIGSPADPVNIPATAGGTSGGTGSIGATDAFGAKIVAAALAQLNREQDCTMLVTHALEAVGINFHGWPADYMNKLGTVTTNPQPGDLIYYKDGGIGLAHIAVLLSPEKAIHGGWDGHTTKIGPANLGSGPIYVHVNR